MVSLMQLAEKFEWIAAETERSAAVLERAHSELAERFFADAKRLRERAEELRNILAAQQEKARIDALPSE